MLARLLLLFISVPLIELVLLLFIADKTSFWFTLGLVILTGIAGSVLARSQGWQTYHRIQQELAQGRMPAQELLDAVLIFCAGALLLTPGVLTDLFGLSLLIPPMRRFYRGRLIKWFKGRFHLRTVPPLHMGRSQVVDSYVVDRSKEPEKS